MTSCCTRCKATTWTAEVAWSRSSPNCGATAATTRPWKPPSAACPSNPPSAPSPGPPPNPNQPSWPLPRNKPLLRAYSQGAGTLGYELDDFLLRVSGHTGYGIRPSARGRGLVIDDPELAVLGVGTRAWTDGATSNYSAGPRDPAGRRRPATLTHRDGYHLRLSRPSRWSWWLHARRGQAER